VELPADFMRWVKKQQQENRAIDQEQWLITKEEHQE
jgi:hypothetical protein